MPWVAAAPIIAAGIGALASGIASNKGLPQKQKDALAAQAEASKTQSEALKQRQALIALLEAAISGGGDAGLPKLVSQGELLRGPGRSSLSDSQLRQVQSVAAKDKRIAQLLQLAGIPIGTDVINSAGAAANQAQQLRGLQTAQLGEGIAGGVMDFLQSKLASDPGEAEIDSIIMDSLLTYDPYAAPAAAPAAPAGPPPTLLHQY